MADTLCNAVGCTSARHRSQFMCLPHWTRLPAPLRQQINATWRAYQGAGMGERGAALLDYHQACDEAKRWTAEGEGRLGDFTPEAPRFQRLLERMEGE